MSILKTSALCVVILLVLTLGFFRLNYVETAAFPDRTTIPLYQDSSLEVVANLPSPPGNIAVAENGDVYFTFHPEAKPEFNVAKLVNGKGEAFPNMNWQPGGDHPQAFNEVLSVRIDNQQNLWVLDNGLHGLKQARLLAFNLETKELVHSYTFSKDEFPMGSHANDFQISQDSSYIIMSDASIIGQSPALVIYDVKNKKLRRILEGHESVIAGKFEPVVQGRAMTLFGLFTVNPGVDGIALDLNDKWLYFASISSDLLYRLPFSAAINWKLSESELAGKVEVVIEKTMTDGMVADDKGNVYLTDLEHSAIIRKTDKGELETLFISDKLRWPDGFSFGPDNYIYVTCSSLHQVIGKSGISIKENGPYQIYRFRPDMK